MTRRPRGRPRLRQPPRVYRPAIRCYPGLDDDLIAFFESLPRRGMSVALKAALRSGDLTPQAVGDGFDEDAALEELAALLL